MCEFVSLERRKVSDHLADPLQDENVAYHASQPPSLLPLDISTIRLHFLTNVHAVLLSREGATLSGRLTAAKVNAAAPALAGSLAQ